ncbi:MAG: Calx-beta domain-containing protein, partial [Cyclobacteriaceae bacterium]
MKNIFIAILILGAVAACTDFAIEDQDFSLQEVPAYVSFGNTSGTTAPAVLNVNEGATTTSAASFRIYAPIGALSDITVTYTLGGTATFGTDYTIAGATASGGTVVLPFDARLASGNRDVNDFPYVRLPITAMNDGVADVDETVVITLTNAVDASGKTYAIGRGGQDLQKTATATIKNVALTVSLVTTSASLTEGSTAKTALAFVTNFNAPEDITISLEAQGDAVLGADFSYKSGNPLPATVTLLQGKNSVSVDTLMAINDDLMEAKDSIIFALTGATIGGTGNTVTIGADTLLYKVKDDTKQITMARAASDTLRVATINDAGNKLLPVSLSSASGQVISISYTITGGTAGVDYIDLSGGTVTFAAGQTKTDITINIPTTAVGGGVKKLSVQLTAASLVSCTDTEAAVVAT